jgi:hypothetical protein
MELPRSHSLTPVRRVAGALLLLLATGCAGGATTLDAPAGTQAVVRSELVFGRLKPDGSVVSDTEWRAFVEGEITPRFPDGFTVQDVLGQYRGRDGRIIAEPSKILLIIHGADTGPRTAIQEIRDAYRRLFQQESVLLIESPARAGF